MDDSSDQTQDKIYVVCGFLADTSVWFEAQRYWEARVKRDGLDYFRATDANRLKGEFEKLVKQYGEQKAGEIRDQLVTDLWQIIRTTELFGCCLLGSMQAYKTVRSEPYSEYVFQSDAFVQAHEHLIYHVAAQFCDSGVPPEPIAFVFDEHSKAALLMSRWAEQKANSPKAAPCMGTLAPLDDRTSPAIQMGDLLANTTKRLFENRMNDLNGALEELKAISGKRNLMLVGGPWTEEYLRELRDVSIEHATRPSVEAYRLQKSSG